MTQHDYNLQNASGAAFRADLNAALLAIVSNNSGNSSPEATFAGQIWEDTSTTPSIYKLRNSANDAWIELLQVAPDGSFTFAGTGSLTVPDGTTAQRNASPAAGMIRFNTTINQYEGYDGAAWTSIGGGATGGGSDNVFYENAQTVTTDYTLSAGTNASCTGPITINSGVTVTVGTGQVWMIL
jgi:hypothetical protein|tara:strand:- start:6851 stop:7399 length:549 start_codon:yes stop_codon:yes gene_type:complete